MECNEDKRDIGKCHMNLAEQAFSPPIFAAGYGSGILIGEKTGCNRQGHTEKQGDNHRASGRAMPDEAACVSSHEFGQAHQSSDRACQKNRKPCMAWPYEPPKDAPGTDPAGDIAGP